MHSAIGLNLLDSLFVFVAALLLWWLYRYYTSNFSLWKNRGVQYETPLPFFGNMFEVIIMKKSHFHVVDELYKKFSGLRYFGLYRSVIPYLVLRDPDIVKDILVDRFDCFRDRGWVETEFFEPMFHTVYTLEGKAWETLRKELCTVFRKEKNLNVFEIVFKSAKRVITSLWDPNLKHKDVEVREMFVRYCTDISGLYLLGLELNSVEDFTSIVRNLYYVMCGVSWKTKLAHMCLLFFPRWWKLLKILQEDRLQEFLVGFTKAIMRYREDNFVIRDDLLQLLIKLKNNNTNYTKPLTTIGARSKSQREPILDNAHVEVSNIMIAAHVLDFVIAGPEIMSIYMSYCAYELALNQVIQETLRNEIDTVLRQTGGKFTYETIDRLKFLDQVLNETLRKYDMWQVERICTKPYVISGSNMMIEKGDRVMIPTHSFSNDPKYFPNPHIFDPDRFSKENRSSLHPFIFTPFGEGPRNCICTDYCKIQFKVGIATLLMHYKLDLCDKSVVPLHLETTPFGTIPSKGVWLKIEKR